MIVGQNPKEGLDQADMAWFDSDLPDNMGAIREIDEKAASYGMLRVGEGYLRTFLGPGNKIVRRGFCYRPTPTGLLERVDARRGPALEGAPSDELVREMRDKE